MADGAAGSAEHAELTPSADWQLWRADDNGGRFLVAAGLSESEARSRQLEMERRGHKQYYWVQRAAGLRKASGGADQAG